MLIDILIPTYNRAEAVEENLSLLQQRITEENLLSQVRIIVSDNASPDDTQERVNRLVKDTTDALEIIYHRNAENIGLEKNAVRVLKMAESLWVLFLGDDDHLAEGYLSFCVEQIKSNPELGCIIPGLSSIYSDGTEVIGRKESFDIKSLEAGYESLWEYSHLGHQMSGLVCKREDLLASYLAKPEYRNPYLFLYFVAYSLYKRGGIYAPSFRTRVNAFNEKDWGYNKVGLLDEVFKSYYYFLEELEEEQVRDLLLRFTVVHSYRLNLKSSTPLRHIKQYRYLVSSTPRLAGFSKRLAALIFKDYVKVLVN